MCLKQSSRLPKKNSLIPIPGGIQDQVEWGLGHPDLVGGNPAHGMWMELGGLKGPFQPKLFCNLPAVSDAQVRETRRLIK